MSATAIKVVPFVATRLPKQRIWRTAFSLALADVLAAWLATCVALLFFRGWHPGLDRIAEYLGLGLSIVPAFAAFGLYPLVGISPVQEFRRIITGSSVVYGIVAATRIMAGADGRDLLTRLTFTWTMTFVLVLVNRAMVRSACARYSWWGVPTIIFGSGSNARMTNRFLQRNANVGLKVVAVFDEADIDWPELDSQNIRHGSIQDGLAFAAMSGIDHAIIALSGPRSNTLQDILRYELHGFKHLLVVPDLSNISSLWVEPRDIGGVLALHVSQALRHPLSRTTKRLIDVAITFCGAVLLLPVFLLLCLAIRLGSKGPILYGHTRIGRNQTTFKVWKFRSMYQNGDEILRERLAREPELKREWERDHKLKKDPRVTPLGRLMRKTSLDELPQLWNVLAGDMSLVGPRPIVTAEIQRYGADFQAYAAVRPGITGLWQISGRNNTSYEERVQFDEYYVRNWSVFLDLYIILRTVKTVLAGEGAY
jgi:Undecaprenyl-phosphate galactose phosphotransferase WbaP